MVAKLDGVPATADFARLEAGDVLVFATTMPAWTPLFASTGALVATSAIRDGSRRGRRECRQGSRGDS
jgi:hypothetical protein